jgi:DNA polymerase-1
MTLSLDDYDLDAANKFKEQLRRTGIFVLDVETHKTDTFDTKELMGVAIGIPDGPDLSTFYFSADEFEEIHDLIQGKEMIGFSLMFDLEILEQNGYTHNGFVWDVLVMMHLANENEYQFSLDFLSLKYLRETKGVHWGESIVPIDKLEKIYGWDDIPFMFMSEYAQQDIRLTYALWIRARTHLEQQKLANLYKVSARYVRALQHVVQEGLLIDWNLLETMQKEGRAEMERLEGVIGFEPSRRKMLDELLYEQMKLPCLSFTQKGQRGQDKEALSRLIDRFPEHAVLFNAVLRWRNLAKADSTWYDGFKKRRTSTDRIHPGLKQHGTVTGRLSCAEPNLQQIPRDSSRVKRLFVDPPGSVLVEFDYNAVELRLGSYYAMKLGHDPIMYELFMEGLDPHAATAEVIGAYEQLDDRGTARQVGKTGNFAWIYGVGAETFKAQLYRQFRFNCTIPQAEAWKDAFHGAYPGFRRANLAYADYHKRHGYVEMWNRRRARIIPEIPGIQAKHHIAFNRVVQGGCGQVLMQATIMLSEKIRRGEIDARICNSVHDSLWFYIAPDKLEEVTAQIIDIMETPPTERFGIPFSVEAKQLNKEA